MDKSSLMFERLTTKTATWFRSVSVDIRQSPLLASAYNPLVFLWFSYYTLNATEAWNVLTTLLCTEAAYNDGCRCSWCLFINSIDEMRGIVRAANKVAFTVRYEGPRPSWIRSLFRNRRTDIRMSVDGRTDYNSVLPFRRWSPCWRDHLVRIITLDHSE